MRHFQLLQIDEPEPGYYLTLLTDFTIYRTRRLLSSRLEYGRKYRGDKTIRLIEAAWNPRKNAKVATLPDPMDDWRKDTSIKVRSEYVVNLLEAVGITRSTSTSDKPEFPLTTSNRKRWARVLRDALERLENGVKSLKDVVGSSEESRWAELRQNILLVRCNLQVIHEFVRLGVVSKLVTPNLALALRSRYTVGVRKFQTKGMCRQIVDMHVLLTPLHSTVQPTQTGRCCGCCFPHRSQRRSRRRCAHRRGGSRDSRRASRIPG
ncbi:hypothetical protein C8Q74DRAFT_679603 [Fomes fomentarius]|nr:hypothetical protein C8Q74DRAFT_679603 [Fomes fomentarius]